MAFSNVAMTTKIGFVGLCAALLLFLIAFGSKHWLDNQIAHVGLWIEDIPGVVLPAWFEAVQAMECLALITGFAAVILLALYMFVESLQKAVILLLAKLAPMAAAGFSMVGVIIYGAKTDELFASFGGLVNTVEVLGWSFWLCLVSSILFFAFGVMVILERRQV